MKFILACALGCFGTLGYQTATAPCPFGEVVLVNTPHPQKDGGITYTMEKECRK